MKVKVADIIIKSERFREDFGEVEELAVSIQRFGLFHSIIVDSSLNLIAGERRLKAHKLLGIAEIEVKIFEDLDELEKREIEIEENLRRKDFTWQEEIKAKGEVDRIKRELYGDAVKGHGGGWGLKETAESLGRSIGTVSRDLRLAKALEDDPSLLEEKTKEAAWNRYLRKQERGVVEAMADKIVVDVDLKCLVNGDSVVETQKLKSGSVDLLLTDPPFGINLESKSGAYWGGKMYEDDDEPQRVFDFINLILKECYRALKPDRHAYIFFDIRHHHLLWNMLTDIGFHVNPVPCIWSKLGAGGAGGNMYAYPSNYESCFFAMKGRRKLNKPGKSNVWSEQRVTPTRKIHPTERPAPLLREMIEQSSLPGELVIDPFAGSASTLVAAFQTKRLAWGCEKDSEYYSKAVVALQQFKSQKKEGDK